MIDWIAVGFGALWIFGLALLLAALSMADYRRVQSGKKWREVWAGRSFQVLSNAGLMCFCFGLIGIVRTDWEGVMWGALGLGFAAFALRAWRNP